MGERNGGVSRQGEVGGEVDWVQEWDETGLGDPALILTPGPDPVSLPWAAQVCSHIIAGIDPSSPIGLAGTQWGERELKSPYSQTCSSPALNTVQIYRSACSSAGLDCTPRLTRGTGHEGRARFCHAVWSLTHTPFTV